MAGSKPDQTLFKNVNIFDGLANKLSQDQHVLINGDLITKIGTDIRPSSDSAKIVDGKGLTLMPGLIDGHAHLMINDGIQEILTNLDITDLAYNAVTVAKRFLMDGFTTVRDMGGPSFGLARAIEGGKIFGPRVYPSGAFISQTSGHGDARDRYDMGFTNMLPGDISNMERMGIGNVADGVPEVLKAVRLQLRNGATQIKLMAGGGVCSRDSSINYVPFARKLASLVRAREEISDGRAMATVRFALRSPSPAIRNFLPGSYERSKLFRSETLALRNLWKIPRFDPIDTTQFSKEEVSAAVEAAADWGTYVGAHVFNDRAATRLLDAGVKSFEHGFFFSDAVLTRIAQNGAFVVPNLWGISPEIAKHPLISPDKKLEFRELGQSVQDFGRNLLKNKVKVVFGSDYFGKFEDAERERRYEIWWRTQMFDSNFEVLKQMTSTAGELVALAGPRNPHKGFSIICVTFARKLASLVRAREEISDGRAMATVRFALRSHSSAIRKFLPGSFYERSELSCSEELPLRNLWKIPKKGPLGVIREGAYADLLLVEGNPLEDIGVIGGTKKWFDADPKWEPIDSIKLVMKNGVVYHDSA